MQYGSVYILVVTLLWQRTCVMLNKWLNPFSFSYVLQITLEKTYFFKNPFRSKFFILISSSIGFEN